MNYEELINALLEQSQRKSLSVIARELLMQSANTIKQLYDERNQLITMLSDANRRLGIAEGKLLAYGKFGI